MKNLKKIIIVVILIGLGFVGGLFAPKIQAKLANICVKEDAISADIVEDGTDTVSAGATISVESFADIPYELPEGWAEVEITTKLPAVALGVDFSNYDSFFGEGHHPEEGFDLATFCDDRYEFFITNPTINTEIAKKCAENGYGVLAVSIYDKEYYGLKTKVIFYDQTKKLNLQIASCDVASDNPEIRYSGGAFASIDDLVVLGDEENETHLWNLQNQTIGLRYTFNPYSVAIYNLYARDDGHLIEDNIGEAISLISDHAEYLADLKNQIDDYEQISEYFTDENAEYSEFDLDSFIKARGGKVTTSFESSYLDPVDEETGERLSEPILDTATEIMNIQIDDLNIVVFYQYDFMAMDDVLYDVAVNGRVLTYDDVHENNREYRHEDLSSTVKIGQEAKISRAEFDYLLDLIENSNN